MSDDVTPGLCSHCGRLMQFESATRSTRTPGAFDETWRCPENRWWLHRTVLAPRVVNVPRPRGRRAHTRRHG